MAEEPPTTGEHTPLGPMELIDLRTGESVLATTGDLTRYLQPEEPSPLMNGLTSWRGSARAASSGRRTTSVPAGVGGKSGTATASRYLAAPGPHLAGSDHPAPHLVDVGAEFEGGPPDAGARVVANAADGRGAASQPVARAPRRSHAWLGRPR